MSTLPASLTYDEASRWLQAIGGERIASCDTATFGSVLVRVNGGTRDEIARLAPYNLTLTGERRETAIRDAFVRACSDLRVALRPDRPASTSPSADLAASPRRPRAEC